jgi:hypothetical protein
MQRMNAAMCAVRHKGAIMKTTMTRTVKGRIRYYTLELIPNLFGEWLLIRRYGSIKRCKPNNEISHIYATLQEAQHHGEQITLLKYKRGYRFTPDTHCHTISQ